MSHNPNTGLIMRDVSDGHPSSWRNKRNADRWMRLKQQLQVANPILPSRGGESIANAMVQAEYRQVWAAYKAKLAAEAAEKREARWPVLLEQGAIALIALALLYAIAQYFPGMGLNLP